MFLQPTLSRNIIKQKFRSTQTTTNFYRNSSNFLSKGIGNSIDLALFWVGKIKIIKTKNVSVFATKTKMAGASTNKKVQGRKKKTREKKEVQKKMTSQGEKEEVEPEAVGRFFFYSLYQIG